MRTTWNGSISFSLVTIPVGLAPATKPSARASDVSFRQLHVECKSPIKNRRWCPVHEREVESDEIVRGWEVAKGQFVIVDDADLEAIERSNTSRSIDIERFVPLDDVDPVYFDRTYFLVPGNAPAALRPYVLLRNVLADEKVGAVGRFVLAGKEKLCLIRPKGDALVLETLFVAEDVYSQAEIDEATDEAAAPKKAELDLAKQLVGSLAGGFDPREQLTSEYRQDLRKLLEAKLDGQPIEEPEPVPEAPVIDLMAALKQSVADAKKRKAPEPVEASAPKPRARRAAAKK
jgi:DNA end-binding protein Ku